MVFTHPPSSIVLQPDVLNPDFLQSEHFTTAILRWFEQHGRKSLPWQHNPTPYRVWVSEIMLQQTQVITVLEYYQRFMQAYPTLEVLANAPLDGVLHMWTGLGYYTRARNLHKTAQQLWFERKGVWPETVAGLSALPGIGRSTAGAIVSLSGMGWAAILDGNVRRVLARVFALEQWPGDPKLQAFLWQLAEQLTPCQNTAQYNQAMMDLGAMICTRSKPRCSECPLNTQCRVFLAADKAVTDYPISKPKKLKPQRDTWFLLLQNRVGAFWLEKRPSAGVWASLWTFPEFGSLIQLVTGVNERYGLEVDFHESAQVLPAFRHSFTHYHLNITPVWYAGMTGKNTAARDTDVEGIWYDIKNPSQVGLAAPVKKLMNQVHCNERAMHES